MSLRKDLERFRQIGEERRQDLADFIRYGDLSASDEHDIRIPIKIVELPEFRFDRRDRGGIGEGDLEVGDVIDEVGGDGEEAGVDGGDHRYYEMDPQEFARELDEELGLELEPKGKKVVERVEGSFTDRSRAGPESMLDVKHLFVEGLKRKLATEFDETFMRELLRVESFDPERAFDWARARGIPVPLQWLVDTYETIPTHERNRWDSIDALEAERDYARFAERIRRDGFGPIPFRKEDERYRHAEVVDEHERNVVVVNIRDVSGSMREDKRELVERTLSPLDWYLQGKYDHAEFVYIAHDADAWEVERQDFFGITSGGGTRISSAYELAARNLETYPWEEWNRFVFAAGDSENSATDTREHVIPLIDAIPANLHAYVETTPSANGRGRHAERLERHFSDREDVVVSYVHERADVLPAIGEILRPEAESQS